MHPLKCGCRGCWRLMRCGEDGGGASPTSSLSCRPGRGSGIGSGFKSLGSCLSASTSSSTSNSNSSTCKASLLHPLSCVPCSGSVLSSPIALKKKLGGCLPCAPISTSSSSFRALQSCVGGCNPSIKSVSSSCSFCSSDPIVTYDPRGSKGSSASRGALSSSITDDDDYSVRTIWPEELARKMSRSKIQQQQQLQQTRTTNPVILDCRNLMEYTRNHLQGTAMHFTDSAGRRRLQQSKLAVLDFITSSTVSNREGRDSLKRLWPKDQINYSNGEPSSPPSTSPVSSTGTLPVPTPKDVPSKPQLSSQSLHLVLNSLNKEQDDSQAKGGLAADGQSQCDSSVFPSFDPDSGQVPLTPDIENAELSPILPFLFLGNESDAQDLDRMLRLNIAYVVNVTTHLPLYHLETGLVRYKRLPATDNSKQNLRQYFEEAFEFIEEAHQCGKGVLIHCQAGVSRSATIVIAYLMKHTLMTMTDAYKFVKGKRPVISPNLNFMGQLLEFENDLNSGVTPRILTPKLTGVETQV
ncbi:dual specificity protein phosphatase 10 [Polypterus senegalus]|nr:dual specificity protein phosphatase 10 [Polypterus senegalus]